MTIFIEDSFDSAHWLPNVPDGHKCKRMHGHTYRVRIEITGPVGETTGWVLDYDAIKKMWNQAKAQLDHVTLNDILPNPTCELLAKWIAASSGPWCSRVEIRETEHCGAIWTP